MNTLAHSNLFIHNCKNLTENIDFAYLRNMYVMRIIDVVLICAK